MAISNAAIDLISHLLRAKENRLSDEQYNLNDCLCFPELNGRVFIHPLNPTTPNYRGRHVYSDDAKDIKAHPFFRGIPWNEMPYRRPPFVPAVKNWEDTKYFDEEDEEETTDAENTSNDTNASNLPQTHGKQIVVNLPDTVDAKLVTDRFQNAERKNLQKVTTKGKATKVLQRKKEKKRARDKILRDAAVGKTALDLRKKGAFVGYTYRRPKPVRLALETERGRSLVDW
jgi:predicted ATPase